MSADSFTNVTNESWFSRIGNAFKGILFGLVLFAIAFPLLFWNEGRAIKRHKTLKEGASAVVSVVSEVVDPANEGRLVHVTGRADTEATLTDATFRVSANALMLRRNVEMYQWKESSNSETKKKLGGGTETTTTHSYAKTWSDSLLDSSRFKEPANHQNPSSFHHKEKQLVANPVTMGAFTLPESLVRKINQFEQLPVDSTTTPSETHMNKAHVHEGGYYIGADPTSPQVGDMQITFAVARPTEVSVIARQVGTSYAPYLTKIGGTIELLQTGLHTSEAMIQSAQNRNQAVTWALRAVGFLLMLFGLQLIFRPLSVIADVIPLFGYIVGAGTGLVAFLSALSFWLVTIAIAWLVYRPLLGIALIVIAATVTVVTTKKIKEARARA